MTDTVLSKNQIPIRLTDERWAHITEEHSELAGLRREVLDVVANPEKILEGREGEKLAVREVGEGKRLVVVYREFENDGFIITAFTTGKKKFMEKRKQLWLTSP
jgi:hypothetical protein